MTDEAKALVERLRDLQEPLHEWDYSAAADLIETQAREIERLREALLKICHHSTDAFAHDTAATALGDSHD